MSSTHINKNVTYSVRKVHGMEIECVEFVKTIKKCEHLKRIKLFQKFYYLLQKHVKLTKVLQHFLFDP